MTDEKRSAAIRECKKDGTTWIVNCSHCPLCGSPDYLEYNDTGAAAETASPTREMVNYADGEYLVRELPVIRGHADEFLDRVYPSHIFGEKFDRKMVAHVAACFYQEEDLNAGAVSTGKDGGREDANKDSRTTGEPDTWIRSGIHGRRNVDSMAGAAVTGAPESAEVTRFFLDTEFIESGPGRPIELLSIGIVCEDGRELYAVNADADLSGANDWVKANVIPHLLRYDDLKVGEPRRSRESLREYVREFVGDRKPEFWGYYADYDWVVFAQLFGAMMDLPKGWPMYCRDIKQFAVDCGDPALPTQSSTEHNALNDARWNKQTFEYLQAYASRLLATVEELRRQIAAEKKRVCIGGDVFGANRNQHILHLGTELDYLKRAEAAECERDELRRENQELRKVR